MTGKQFGILIKERGLTRKAVSSEIGIHPSALSNYLNMKGDISRSKYYRLCELLGIDVLF